VSIASSSSSADGTCTRDSSLSAATGCDDVEQFLVAMSAQLEEFWGKLDTWRQAIVAERRRLEGQLRERTAELDREQAALHAQRLEFREEIHREASAAAANMVEAVTLQKRQMAQERAQWLDELSQIRQFMKTIAERPANP
jgi:hypothetical protein